MASKKKTFIIIGIIAVVAVIIILNLSMSTSNAITVSSEKAQLRDLVEVVSASGRIQPKTKVDITSEINGEIIDLYVREGDRVEAGDLLVVLDTVQLRSSVDQARYAVNETTARLEGAKSVLDQAQEEYERQERLYKNDLTSETAYKNAKYAYQSARATYEATQAQAQQWQAVYEKELDNFEKAIIRAPMSGIITFLDCEEGEIAAAQTAFTQGKTLMTISNLNVFEVEVEVDETEITKVDLGQDADIEVDAFPDTVFPGEVVEIGNTAIYEGVTSSSQSTNFRVKVVFKEPNVKIRPGMSATVDITTDKRENVLTISYSAVVMRTVDLDSLRRANEPPPAEEPITDDAGIHAAETAAVASPSPDEDEAKEELKGVFVIRDNQAAFQPVETGIADQKYIQVRTGLNEGDVVVSGPYRVLRTIENGDEVEAEKEKKESE